MIPSYLALASLIIIVFLINYWLESGDLDFPYFSYISDYISELFFLLLSGFFLVLAVLSFIFWGILLLTKSKIAETKQQAFETQKIKSQYSGFRDLAVSFRCIDSTNFGQANLIEADFGNSDVTGVNFRGARLKRTIWTKAKGLECAAIGNSYLKYPKVRNWVVRVGNDKIVGGDIRNGN
nr:pentapeptide repeat-containing protein [Microcystis flos-aquae]